MRLIGMILIALSFIANAFAMPIPSEKIKNSIYEIAENPFFISSNQVEDILNANPGLSIDQLLVELVPIAQMFARPLISNYKVGVAGLGASGNIYLGVNLEFADLPSTIHGEQFMAINARNFNEQYIQKIAISAAPCGYCRQFLNEIGNEPGNEAGAISILIPGRGFFALGDLLPQAFGPGDLGFSGGLLSPHTLPTSDDPYESARQAALGSYAPYSKCYSGVSIQTKDGRNFTGSYIENAAFNPAIAPLTAALVQLVAANVSYDDIISIVLAEAESCQIKQEFATYSVLMSINPQARLDIISLR